MVLDARKASSREVKHLRDPTKCQGSIKIASKKKERGLGLEGIRLGFRSGAA